MKVPPEFENEASFHQWLVQELQELADQGFLRELQFARDMVTEVIRARVKFPTADHLTLAMAEEAGELVKAMLDEPPHQVRTEAVQTAAMACRLALEGDPTVGELRVRKGLELA
jgi:hypothetical protein